MKIIIFKNSILFLRVDPENNTVDAYFVFAISWICFKFHEHEFSFDDITMAGIKQFYKTLADDWTGIYRI
jgi:hypothetical protein